MTQVDGKRIHFTEDDFYKTLKEHDAAILKKFNDKDLNDEDYFLAQPSLDDNQSATLDGPEYLNFMKALITKFIVQIDFYPYY